METAAWQVRGCKREMEVHRDKKCNATESQCPSKVGGWQDWDLGKRLGGFRARVHSWNHTGVNLKPTATAPHTGGLEALPRVQAPQVEPA